LFSFNNIALTELLRRRTTQEIEQERQKQGSTESQETNF